MSLASLKSCASLTTTTSWRLDAPARAARPAVAAATRLAPTDHQLTVIIPAYNEQARLPRSLANLGTFLEASKIEYRVLVADDGSQDATGRLTDSLGERFSTLRLNHAGKGGAVRSAMLAATGEVVAFTDADLPYDLAALVRGHELILRHQCEVVWGSRRVNRSADAVGRRWARRMATGAFNAVVKRLMTTNLSDIQCGLKLFSRRAAIEIFSRTRIDGFAFDAEVVLLAERLGLRCQQIPVTLVNDQTTTVSLMRDALPMLLDVFKTRARLGHEKLVPRLAEGWGRLGSDPARRAA